jgi:hypothetical protein
VSLPLWPIGQPQILPSAEMRLGPSALGNTKSPRGFGVPLTEPHARVLGALSTLGPWMALTVRQLSDAAGLPASRVRAVLLRLTYDGLVLGRSNSPADYWITRNGRTVIGSATYREYRTGRDVPSEVSK